MKQMGVGLAVAVLIDATLIRAVLLPASTKLLGDWNWYLPRSLEWLPTLSHERAEQVDAVPGLFRGLGSRRVGVSRWGTGGAPPMVGLQQSARDERRRRKFHRRRYRSVDLRQEGDASGRCDQSCRSRHRDGIRQSDEGPDLKNAPEYDEDMHRKDVGYRDR
ncbi:MAG TPA: hypothetical protein VGQ38_14945 [Gaiellaceae bacterium]|nr:hypothetical protein [Gaiellaceae bacterium]